MAEQAREFLTIDASVEQCFAVLADFDSYPSWAGDLKEVAILERDDQGRALLVEFRAAAMGRSTRYQLRYDYSEAPNRLGWHLESGDIQRELDGAYVLEESKEKPGATEVTYEISVDLIIPIPGFQKRRAEAKILRTALDDLKARVEGLAA